MAAVCHRAIRGDDVAPGIIKFTLRYRSVRVGKYRRTASIAVAPVKMCTDVLLTYTSMAFRLG